MDRRRAGRPARGAARTGAAAGGTRIERLVALLRASPGYAIAGFVHLLALVILSLVTVVSGAEDQVARPVEVRLVAQTDVVVGPDLRTRAGIDLLPLPDVAQSNTQDSSQQAFGETLGAMAAEAVSGVGGGGGFGRGGAHDARGGASAGSDAAIRAALDWLARHRTADGAWGKVPGPCRRAPKVGQADTAYTALALLCFLFAGDAEDVEARYPGLVARATDWLVARVDAHGVVGDATVRAQWLPRRGYEGYHQAITALALAEALARREHPPLRAALRRLVDRLESAQSREVGGWRYLIGEEGDTSVTAWTILALAKAEQVGVAVQPDTWARARAFVEAVSQPDGKTEYMVGFDEDDPAKDSLGMHATGLFLRILFGERPDTPRNQAAVKHVLSIMKTPAYRYDAYAVYAGALAMHQVGGEPWLTWNQPVRDGIVKRQTTGERCERGAWGDDCMWLQGDILLSTVFATLTLETYYRDAPMFPSPGEAPARLARAPRPESLTRGLDLLGEAARPGAEGSQALVKARSALEEALAEATSAPQARAEARAGLVVAAALARDTDQVLALSEGYLRELPRGVKADREVLRARRAALLDRALKAVQGASDDPGRAAVRLQAIEGALRADLDHMARDDEDRARAEAALVEVERAGRRLAVVVSPELFVARGMAALPPPSAPAADDEVLLLELLLDRVEGALAGDGVDAAALERAAADLTFVEGRDPARRLDDAAVRARIVGRLDRAHLQRLAGLQALGRDREVLAGVATLRERSAGGAGRAAALDALELGALLRLRGGPDEPPSGRARLVELARAVTERQDLAGAVRPGTWLALGLVLRDEGEAEAVLACAERALDGSPAADEALEARALRGWAHMTLGDADRAELDVAAVERAGLRDRVDVRLVRAALLRRAGRHAEALSTYQAIVRALDGARPPAAWWTAVEEIARTYAEVGDLPAARRILAETARRDRTFGGDPARQRRLIDLMVQLDARR